MNTYQSSEKELLRKYEPILYFDEDENFFPMDADAYIEACKLKPMKSGNGQKLKGENLRDLDATHFLHFVHDNAWGLLFKYVIFLLFAILLFVIWYSLQPNQFGLLKSLFCCWPPIWKNPSDTIRFVIFSLAILSWPFLQGSRRVHIAFVIAIVTILFFGTLLGVAFGLLAIIISTYLSLFYWIQQKNWRSHFSFLVSAIVGFIIVLGLPFGFVLGLDEILHFNRPLIINTSIFKGEMDFTWMIVILLFVAVSAMLLWFLAGYVLRQLFKKLDSGGQANGKKRGKISRIGDKLSLQEELRPVLVLVFSIMVLVGLFFLFAEWGFLGEKPLSYDAENRNRTCQIERSCNCNTCYTPEKHSRALAFAIIATTAASAGFWFFQDPTATVIRDIRKETWLNFKPRDTVATKSANSGNRTQNTTNSDEDNDPVKLNYLRVLFISLIGFLLYLILSTLLVLFQLPWFRFEVTPGILMLLPIVFMLVVFFIIFITVGLVGSEVAGFVMDLFSRQPDTIAERAKRKYVRLKREAPAGEKYWYYGRVRTDDEWTVLQYHYFYAFNDWRRAAGGMNQHEGDWEAVAIFLKTTQNGKETKVPKLKPIAVAYSQHHHGKLCFWEADGEDDKNKMITELDEDGNLHPVVYVARGSHANYHKPQIYPTSMLVSGAMRTIVSVVDAIIRRLTGQEHGLPTEHAKGARRFGMEEWHCELLDELPWVTFTGLWGNKTRHKDESGPTGPQWKRYEDRKDKQVKEERPRWGLHEWKDMLLLDMVHNEDMPINVRRKALRDLVWRSE